MNITQKIIWYSYLIYPRKSANNHTKTLIVDTPLFFIMVVILIGFSLLGVLTWFLYVIIQKCMVRRPRYLALLPQNLRL